MPGRTHSLTFGRPRRADGAEDVAAYLRGAADRPAAVGDLLWSLMTTAEFRFNH